LILKIEKKLLNNYEYINSKIIFKKIKGSVMRKPRQQKTFNDKFQITTDIIKPSFEKKVYEQLKQFLTQNKLKINDINHKNLKEILSKTNLYQGVFYIQPDFANRKMLNLNIENVAQDVVKLNKQIHNDNDWAYNNDEFQKVYVLHNDGVNALICITYNDSFTPLIIQSINTVNIYFEGNIAKQIIEFD
jgi:homogentisate 1,2-dioxygenase